MWLQRKQAARSRVPSLSVLLSVPRSRALSRRAWCRMTAKPGTFLGVPVFPGGMLPRRGRKPGSQLIGFATEGLPGVYRGLAGDLAREVLTETA